MRSGRADPDEAKVPGGAVAADEPVPDFVRLLRCLQDRIEVEALVLFGSRARGDAFARSDWDLVVLSGDFEGRDPIERAEPALQCPPPGVELIHLTPGELREPDMSYLRCAILEEGRPLHDRGAFAEARRRYQARKAAGEIVFEDGGVHFPEGDEA